MLVEHLLFHKLFVTRSQVFTIFYLFTSLGWYKQCYATAEDFDFFQHSLTYSRCAIQHLLHIVIKTAYFWNPLFRL